MTANCPTALLALNTLAPILAAANRPEPDMRQIVISQNSIREFSTYDGLSRAILDHDMPEITSTATLDHYTTLAGFSGIMASQELRLALVTFRLSAGELATFALEHGLEGYVDKSDVVSRIGAFYLPIEWKGENETRLLAKRFPGGGAPTITVGKSEYWPIPIGTANKTAGLKLVEIGVRNLNATIITSKLPNWCLGVPVVTG